MKKNQKKWEKEFEKFSRGEFDDRYNELSDKISNKTCTKDELKEFKRLDLVKKNLPKVKNIMEYRDKLNHEREIIDGELKRREEARNLNKERADLEKENADLLLEIDEINSKLKSKDLSEEDRKKLENEKEEKALVEYKSFSERHPILAKIPFLAKIADKLNKSKNEKAMQENENNEKQNDEVINDVAESLGKEVGKIIDEDSKEEKNQNEEFKKYLKDIADKGMDGIKKERMERARVLLAQNKVDKANEYAEKYGSRYNEQDGASKDEGPEL